MVDEAFIVDVDNESEWLEGVERSIQPEVELESNGDGEAKGWVYAGTDGSTVHEGGGKVGFGYVVVTCAGEVMHKEQLIAKGVGGNLNYSEADNNMAELTAVIEVIQSQVSEVNMHLFIDSMYVINGMKEARLAGRKLIRSTCRAEWERLRVLLDSRVGEVRVEHVRSHPKDKGTGEDVEWDDMSFPQRLNSAADEIAEGGRERARKC